MRKLGGLLVLTCMMFVLSGCRMYADYVVNTDGTVTSTGFVAYTKEQMEMLDEDAKASATLKTLEDGKEYYVVSQEPQTKSFAKVKQEDGILITEDMCIYEVGGIDAMAGSETSGEELYLQVSVTFGSEIVSTNGQLSEDGKKVVFNLSNNKDAICYAYTQKGKEMVEQDKIAPNMNGAKDNQYYKKMPNAIEFTDEIVVAEVKLNDKVVFPVTTTIVSNGKTTKTIEWYTADSKKAAKKGKNIFKVKDLNGNEAIYTIYVDNQKPVIKGVKANKTYKKKATIYVKDSYKLSKITINGKKQKMTSKQLVKKGKYKGYYQYSVKKKGTNKVVATDKAGNKKTLKFKIVK